MKHTVRAISCLLLIAAMLLSTACGKPQTPVNSDPTTPGATPTTTPTTAPTTTPTTPTTAPTTAPTIPTTAPTTVPTGPTVPTVKPVATFGTPVMRFAVTSDVHVRDESANLGSYDQLALLYKTAYACSDAQTYNKLDGIFFVGDYTNTGSLAQQTYFFNYLKENTRSETLARAVLGNHEYKATGNFSTDSKEKTAQRFKELSGCDSVDAHIVLGGYHFIFLSSDAYNKSSNIYFTTAKLNWLEKELAAAAAADPNKPIFVFQHEPPKNTVISSYGVNGDKNLAPILAKYPQVIDFSGHSHRPITDTRSIWQGAYTVLNTGSLAYLSLSIPDHSERAQGGANAIDKNGNWSTGLDDSVRDAGMYYIVEIDEKGIVRVLIYNMFTESLWGEPYILDSIDPKDFRYTDARREQADKPVFAANAAITVLSSNYRKLNLAIPQATSKDVVQSYRVELFEGDTLLQTQYLLSGINYGNAAPAYINAYMPDLKPATAYTVKVYAVNSWAKESDPLVLNITTTAENTAVSADVYNIQFREDGSAFNAVTGEVLTVMGAPTVSYDEALGKFIATFDGKDDAYLSFDIQNRYAALTDSFSLEAYVYLEKKPSSGAMNFASNLQSAGLGLAYTSGGKISFYCESSDSSSYKTPSAAFATGQWVHVVGTFDKTSVKLYINGELAAEVAANGTFVPPAMAYHHFVIGADCSKTSALIESMFKGKIANVNIYSADLSAGQIAALYQQYKGN